MLNWIIKKISPRYLKNIAGSLVAVVSTFLVVTVGLDAQEIAQWADQTVLIVAAVLGYLLMLVLDFGKSKAEKKDS